MKNRWNLFFILVLGISALTCNLPAQVASQPAAPPPPSATQVISGTPAFVTVSSNVPGVQVSIVPVPAPATIVAKDFAALNATLADKIAILNLGQLKFIHDMQAVSRSARLQGFVSLRLQKGTAQTDQDLKDISGYAMDAAILSDQLGELSARQNNGSQPASRTVRG